MVQALPLCGPPSVNDIVKPGQNKKGQKNFQLHRFLNTFQKTVQLAIFFGPSYFDPALVW